MTTTQRVAKPVFDRMPPQNIEAEQSVLGGMLLNSEAVGTAIEVSLFDSLGEWMGYPFYYATYGGSAPTRSGARHATIAPYGPFESRDGSTIYLGVQNEREWVAFCRDVLERPDLATDARFDTNSRRITHLTELHKEIDRTFLTLPASEILARLDRAQIANARLNSIEEFAAHPQVAARARVRDIARPAGKAQQE